MRVAAIRPWMSTTPSLRTRWIPGARASKSPLPNLSLSYASDYHVPVMVREVLAHLRAAEGGVFLDGTLGGGGHSEAILDASEANRVIGVDRDPDARAEATRRLARFGSRFRVVAGNFSDAVAIADLPSRGLDGILLDLGISSHQIDADRRGFTFRAGAPLDMRMEGEEGFEDASDLLNTMDEEELASVFYRYGEEKRSRRLARVVATMRAEAPLTTSDDLSTAIDRVIPRATPQDKARIFQAVRIAVNDEIKSLQIALPRLRDALAPAGTIVVLSYHSLEDRVVKDLFREWSRDCVCPPGLPICVCRGAPLGKLLTRKPAMASADEIGSNTRARSARLRAWRKA